MRGNVVKKLEIYWNIKYEKNKMSATEEKALIGQKKKKKKDKQNKKKVRKSERRET